MRALTLQSFTNQLWIFIIFAQVFIPFGQRFHKVLHYCQNICMFICMLWSWKGLMGISKDGTFLLVDGDTGDWCCTLNPVWCRDCRDNRQIPLSPELPWPCLYRRYHNTRPTWIMASSVLLYSKSNSGARTYCQWKHRQPPDLPRWHFWWIWKSISLQ